MGPPDHAKIGFGVLAAAAVALVSYFLVKKFGFQVKPLSRRRRYSDGDKEVLSEKLVSETSLAQETQPAFKTKDVSNVYYSSEGRKDSASEDERQENSGEDGQNQTSFIVIDNGEGDAQPDNGQHPKKSDRSSDESSYDVIDEDKLEDAVEESEMGDVEKENGTDKNDNGAVVEETAAARGADQESFNDNSMIIIEDSDRSGISKSGSSFYASADENLGVEIALGDQEDVKEVEDENEFDVSRAEEEETIQYAADEKLIPAEDDDPPMQGAEEGEDSKEDADCVSSDQGQTSSAEDQDKSEDITSDPVPVSPDRLKLIAITDAVLGAEQDASQELLPPKENEAVETELSHAEITEVLTTCQNTPSKATKEAISKLVVLLQKKNPDLHSTVLNCLIRVAAFTQNINNLRENGCPEVITAQVRESCQDVIQGRHGAEATLNALCQIVSNLTLDPKSQAKLEDTVPVLVDLVLLDTASDSLRLSALRPLINLSSDVTFHSYYTKAIQELYSLLDTGSNVTKLQSLKVLVNLSLNAQMIPHLLAAKAPTCLLDLLDRPTTPDVILRTVTMLANIVAAMRESKLSFASLPIQEKAASPDTLYIALTGVGRFSNLKSKVFRLTRHDNEDVSDQASKLHKFLTEVQ